MPVVSLTDARDDKLKCKTPEIQKTAGIKRPFSATLIDHADDPNEIQ